MLQGMAELPDMLEVVNPDPGGVGEPLHVVGIPGRRPPCEIMPA